MFRLLKTLIRPHLSSSKDIKEGASEANVQNEVYNPSQEDRMQVLRILQQLKLPIELGYSILDEAEYWVATITYGRGSVQVYSWGDKVEDILHNCSIERLPGMTVRCIRVNLESKDQGWSSSGREYDGTRLGSFSWLEIGLYSTRKDIQALYNFPEDAELLVEPFDFLRNVHAYPEFTKSITSFYPEDENGLVKAVQKMDRDKYPGIRITVCAQYRAWANTARNLRIEVLHG